jgi:diaminopropionate ammonia-lyase
VIAERPDTLAFHRAQPGYRRTPLHEAPALAAELGLERLVIKDESERFGLPAFKYLGASWALHRLLTEDPGPVTRVATATDGNHGRAVARVAAAAGLAATVYVPAGMTSARRAAIAGEGARVIEVDGSYDQAVAASERDAAADPGCRSANDADLDGGHPFAEWVIEGYSTLFAEVDESVDLVMLQTGVGAFAAAGVRFAANHGAAAVAVDPAGAPCIAASLAAGRRVSVESTGTAMAGLDAGTPSASAWPALAAGLAGAVVITDVEATAARAELAALGIATAESGAAGLAGLRALTTDPACTELRETLGNPRRALVIVTEGET